jgi:DNA-binding transcriptional MerR regulator
MDKQPDAFRTIGEAATDLDLPQHVLRFWETRFTQIKPMKGGGGRRYYRIADIDLLRAIKKLLYQDGYTIKGVQKLLREKGGKALLVAAHGGTTDTEAAPVPDLFAEQGSEAPAHLARRTSGEAAHSHSGVAVTDLPDAAALLDLLLGEIDACRSILRQARAG